MSHHDLHFYEMSPEAKCRTIQINLILSCCVHAHAAILFGVFVLLLTNALSHTVKKEKNEGGRCSLYK